MSADPSARHDDPRRRRRARRRVSPTIRSISDSNVTRPAVPPYSSITIASRTPRRRISASSSSAPSVSGTVSASRASAPALTSGSPARERPHEVGHVQHADDVVEVVAIDGQRGCAGRGRSASTSVVARRVGRDRDQLGARHHHLAGRQVGEAEHAVEHLLFVLLEHARFLARGHQHLQLFFRVHHRVAAAAVQAEHADDGPARAVQQPDERPERLHEQLGRLDDEQRRRLRLARARWSSAPARRARCAAR